jgi:hypothetical protein
VQRKLGLQEKLNLGVVWNREDIVAEILETGTFKNKRKYKKYKKIKNAK